MADTENYFDQFDEAPKEANYFDQFDEAPKEANYFDQFDEEPQTVPNIQSDLILGNPNPIITSPSELHNDPRWINAVRGWHDKNEGRPFEGTPEELSEYGLEMMGWFNSNLVATTLDASRVSNADDQLKKDFLYMMDTYDSTDYSWGGTGRFFKGILTDPTTYVGLSTFGVGLVAKEGSKTLAKQGVRELIKGSIKTGTIAGVEGAVITTTDNALRQNIEISAGSKDEFSLLESVGSAAKGFGAGFLLGGSLDVGVTKLKNVKARQKLKDTKAKRDGEEFSKGYTPEPKEGDGVARTEFDPTTLRNPDGSPVELFHPKQEGAFANILGLKVPITNTGVRGGVKSIYHTARALAKDIQALGAKSSDEIIDAVRRSVLTRETHSEISRAVQSAADALHVERKELILARAATDDVTQIAKYDQQLFELDELAIPIQQADDAFGSLAGQDLGARRNGLSLENDLSVEQIARDKGLSKEEAQIVYADIIARAEADQILKGKIRALDDDIAGALAENDIGLATRLNTQKRALKKATLASTSKARGVYNQVMHGFEYFNEWAISNVFTIKTLAINTIPSLMKTIYKPTLNAFFKHGITKGALREIATTHMIMRTQTGAALKAARAAYRYEAALMTRDPLRFLEGGLRTKGRLGGAIRFFPRMLNATDEFFTHLNYLGYVGGEASHVAHEAGVRKGLKGKDLSAYIKREVDKALKLSKDTNRTLASVSPIIKKGENRGLKGDELTAFVEEAIRKDGDYLSGMTNQDAKVYVEDLLFKRKFGEHDGDSQQVGNAISKGVAGYERFVQKNPWMKTMGQLFTRTPIRVYEEGIRLTPGLNLIAPRFIADLKGTNGQARQIRAQGDAMLSLVIGNYAMIKFAKGDLMGGGSTDYEIAAELKDTDFPQAYSVRNEDNGTRNIRNFEPFSVPLKIFGNAMERLQDLEFRKATGEDVGGELQEATKWVTIGYASIFQSVRDANLFNGVASVWKLAEDLDDAERNESAIARFFASKITMVIPNTLNKVGQVLSPEVYDPRTFNQYVMSRMATAAALWSGASEFFGRHTPLKTDAMGYPATRREALDGFIPLAEITALDRKGDVSDDIMYVRRWMFSASMETGAKFRMPFTVATPGFEGVDLRTAMAADGVPLMTKWTEALRAMQPEKELRPVIEGLMESGAPRGIKGNVGIGVEDVRLLLVELQTAAWDQVLTEDYELIQTLEQGEIKDMRIKSGDFDRSHPRANPTPIIK